MTCTESCHSASCPSQLSSQPTGQITATERGLQCQGSPGLQRPVSFEGLMSVNMLPKPQRTRSAFAAETEVRSWPGPHDTARDLSPLGVRCCPGLWEQMRRGPHSPDPRDSLGAQLALRVGGLRFTSTPCRPRGGS